MKKFNSLLFTAAGVLFTFYFMAMQWNNRPGYEENEYLCHTRQNGMLTVFTDFYMNWCGRWSGRAFLGIVNWLVLSAGGSPLVYFIFFALTYFLLLAALVVFFKALFSRYSQGEPHAPKLWPMAMLFASTLYFGALSVTDNWYWMIAALPGIAMLACTVLGAAMLISTTRSKWQTAGIVASFAFISGNAEVFSLPFLLLLIILVCIAFSHKNYQLKAMFLDHSTSKLMLAVIILFTGIAVNLASPGNHKRLTFSQTQTLSQVNSTTRETQIIPRTFFLEKKSAANMIFNKKNRFWLFLFVPFFFAGAAYGNPFPKKVVMKIAGVLLTATICCIIVIIPMMEFVFKNLGPLRTWLPLTTLASAGLFSLFFITGQHMTSWGNKMKHIETLVLIFIIFMFSKHIAEHIPNAMIYSRAYDERVALLRNITSAQSHGAVEVHALPSPLLFVPAEIRHDPESMVNKRFVCANNLPFDVLLSDSETAGLESND